MVTYTNRSSTQRSLLVLLHPRGQGRLFAALLAAGLAAGWVSVTRLSLPLWGAAALLVALLSYPALRKWRADLRELGTPATVLGVLLVTQALHTAEHVAQWVQYHLLGWPLKAASGIISPLNAEVVHFSWNVAVLLAVAGLVAAGFRSRWMWLLLLWAGAHSAEHTYLFVRYLQEVQRLAEAGLPIAAAQGLPGFFGKGGWLASNAPSSGPVAFLCALAPGFTSAPRLDVHFWWNLGEVALLLPAAHASVRRVGDAAAPKTAA
ncbi:MAG TPA: hypothetical protein VNL77_24060 [Roseiflexaceae bacterium]|nr:hypothetical protein [Roseiflexaceae bacterium]